MDVKQAEDRPLSMPNFEFINVDAVASMDDVNIVCLEPCPIREDSLQLHHELLKKGEKDSTFLKVHDEIGVESCHTSGEKAGQCKLAFKDRFSEELIQHYSSIIGTRNEFDEPY